MKLSFFAKKSFRVLAVVVIGILIVFQAALADDLQLASGETINITLTNPTVTYTLTSSTGISSLSASDSTLTLTLDSGDSVVVSNSSGYQIVNSLSQLTTCSGNTSTITFTQTATITASTDLVCATSSGGGGITPSSIGIKINNGNTETTSKTVTLTLSANNASQMILSHSIIFTNALWENYAATKTWTLTAGDGEKRVYVKYKSSTGQESSVISAVITLVGTSTPAPTPTPVPPSGGGGGGAISPAPTPTPTPTPSKPAGEVKPPVVNLEGKIVKDTGKSAVYIVENGILRPYLNSLIFLAHGKKFDEVIETNISTYQMGEGVNIFPDYHDFTCGQLVKASNAKVYIVSRCDEGQSKEITWIETEEAFIKGGWSFQNVNYISDLKKVEFQETESFNAANGHPAGTLVKYKNSPKVYLLLNVAGKIKKSLIVDEKAFTTKGFQFRDVITIPATEVYTTGEAIRSGTVLGVSNKNIFTRNLQYGSSGSDVLLLQEKLQELGYLSKDIKPNGNFGPATQEAVRNFQKANNLDPVGAVGPKTRETLNGL